MQQYTHTYIHVYTYVERENQAEQAERVVLYVTVLHGGE